MDKKKLYDDIYEISKHDVIEC